MKGMDHPEKDRSGKDLPRYTCSKRVWALKIKKVRFEGPPDGPGAILTFEGAYAPIGVGGIYVDWHKKGVPRRMSSQRTMLLGLSITGEAAENLQAGDYWVRTEEGHETWCPAKAFESSFTRNKTPRRSMKRGADKKGKSTGRQEGSTE